MITLVREPAATTVAPIDAACTHCGLPVPAGYIEPGGERQFCCAGCRTAYAILHEHGLDRYYDLPERRDRPVRASGRQYDEFDHSAFHALYVSATADGLARVELYLEGVHCASCVWLVERVPLVVPGVVRAELNIRRSLATIEWDDRATPLSAIARALDSLGYPAHPFRGTAQENHRRREDRSAMVRIGVAGAISINVMLASLALYSGWWSGMEAQYARFFRWTALVLTIPALLWPGRVFFVSALAAVRARTLHMDLPIAVALAAGFARGVVNTVADAGPVYFDGVAMLVFLLLCGRYLQLRGQRAAADAAELLFAITPSTARVVGADGAIRETPAEGLVPGDLIDVRAGDTLPADGVVESGVSSLNLALLTGESRPVSSRPGDEVFAGTLNVASALRIRVTQAGETSRLAKLVRQVEEGARRRAPVVLLADRLSGWFTAAVLVLAALVYVVWMNIDPSQAVDNAIALLVVTCPCALALATPLAVTAAVGRAARRGILIKGGDALERLAKPSTLILDKTGTITEGAISLDRFDGPDWVRPLVLALEAESSHPIAAAFREGLGLTVLPDVEFSHHVIGSGVVGRVGGHDVVIGKQTFVVETINSDRAHTAFEVRAPISEVRRFTHDSGDSSGLRPLASGLGTLTTVWIAVDGHAVARAWFGDAVRLDAARSIETLRRAGWHIGMASGDDPAVAHAVAAQVGIEQTFVVGGASPEAKLALVERASERQPVVMVGDGVNDAAAIAAAAVGIGVHGGAEASLAAADVYLTRPGLAPLVELTDGARRTMRLIRLGILLSLGYNAVGVSLAVTGMINPLVAAVMMPASSLTVLMVAWRGRTFPEAPA